MRNPKLEEQKVHKEIRSLAKRRDKLERMIFNNEMRLDVIKEEMQHLPVRDRFFIDFAEEKMSIEIQNAEFNEELKELSNVKLCARFGMTNEYLNRVIKYQVFVDGDL